MGNETRVVTLPTRFSHRGNSATVCFGGAGVEPLPARSVDPRALFNAHHRAMHAQLLAQRDLGVMVFAACPRRGLLGNLWLRATSELRSASVGRHSSVDLLLPDDEGLSLRHSVLLVRSVLGVPRVRAIDLESSTGFFVGQDGPLHALDADGPFAMGIGPFMLFVIPTGAPPPWAPTALDPWATFPLALVNSTPRLARQRAASRPRNGHETNVIGLPGPTPTRQRLIGHGEAELGTLVLAGPALTDSGQRALAQQRLPVGGAALERGVLVGRYDRCDGGSWAAAGGLSRVHTLVLEVDQALYVIDAGSSNGTWIGGHRVRCAPLPARTDVALSLHDGLRLRWELDARLA